MYSVEVYGVKDGYHRLARLVAQLGKKEETRNGPVLALDGPLMLKVHCPRHRVLMDPARDANPVFHLMEALWMLAGRNDVAFVQQFNSHIGTFSDDGTSFNAAYGHRWAEHFGYDQLSVASDMLNANPQDRRVVLGMWDPRIDLGPTSKDIPCNTQVMFRVVRGGLDMTTINRSNDLVWGLMGANFVHMSIMHEWMAASIGMPLLASKKPADGGRWHHVSNNLHVYERHWQLIKDIEPDSMVNAYRYEYYPTVTDAAKFRECCVDVVNGKVRDFGDEFFDGTVAPLLEAWAQWKGGNKGAAVLAASKMQAWDWRIATIGWFGRRMG